MRRHTDNDWMDSDPVVKLFKMIVTQAMQRYKDTEWAELPGWKFDIREMDLDRSYTVQIIAGVAPVILFMQEREFFIDDDESKKNEKRREVWKMIVVEATMIGMIHAYKTGVEIARNNPDGMHYTKDMADNYLSMQECLDKQKFEEKRNSEETKRNITKHAIVKRVDLDTGVEMTFELWVIAFKINDKLIDNNGHEWKVLQVKSVFIVVSPYGNIPVQDRRKVTYFDLLERIAAERLHQLSDNPNNQSQHL